MWNSRTSATPRRNAKFCRNFGALKCPNDRCEPYKSDALSRNPHAHPRVAPSATGRRMGDRPSSQPRLRPTGGEGGIRVGRRRRGPCAARRDRRHRFPLTGRPESRRRGFSAAVSGATNPAGRIAPARATDRTPGGSSSGEVASTPGDAGEQSRREDSPGAARSPSPVVHVSRRAARPQPLARAQRRTVLNRPEDSGVSPGDGHIYVLGVDPGVSEDK